MYRSRRPEIGRALTGGRRVVVFALWRVDRAIGADEGLDSVERRGKMIGRASMRRVRNGQPLTNGIYLLKRVSAQPSTILRASRGGSLDAIQKHVGFFEHLALYWRERLAIEARHQHRLLLASAEFAVALLVFRSKALTVTSVERALCLHCESP